MITALKCCCYIRVYTKIYYFVIAQEIVESIESVGWGIIAYKLPSLKFSIGGVQIVEIQKSESLAIILIFI
jgi:hypothetical protein